MNNDKYNAEGYRDPTAYEALARIEKAAKQSMFRPLVFICSPFAGDTDGNVRRAREYCRYAVGQAYIPIAPHLLFPQFMDDGDQAQRDLALFFGMVILGRCQEIWVFGEKHTPGMSVEIEKAMGRGMTIRYFTEECKEVST